MECHVSEPYINKIHIINNNFLESNIKSELSVLTYNVYKNTELYMKHRFAYIVSFIDRLNPDIVCLQEVTKDIIKLLAKNNNITKRYVFSCLDDDNIILSKYLPINSNIFKFRFYWNNTENKHTAILLLFENFAVMSTKLPNNKCKNEIIKELVLIMNKYNKSKRVIFVGDFNTDIDGISNKNNLETSLFDNKFKDMWRILRFNETGFTLNTQKNTMLRKIVNKSIYIRRDAIMYGGKDINPKSINMIGKSKLVIEENDKIKSDIFPSTHYGLLGKFWLDFK
jgi:tyrosyl-DNA phosphodiesterase 2